jgi:hypothetical protein
MGQTKTTTYCKTILRQQVRQVRQVLQEAATLTVTSGLIRMDRCACSAVHKNRVFSLSQRIELFFRRWHA